MKRAQKWLNMMMFKKDISEHNFKLPQISGSGKTNTLLNLIKKQDGDNHSAVNKTNLCIADQQNTNILLTNLKTMFLRNWKIQRWYDCWYALHKKKLNQVATELSFTRT